MAQNIVDVDVINIETKKAQTSLKDLKDEIKKLKGELLGLEEGTEDYNKKLQELGNAQFKLKDINEHAALSTADFGEQLGTCNRAVSGLAGGIQSALGVLTMFTGESKASEKAMKTLVAAMSITQGLVALEDGWDSLKNIKNTIKQNVKLQKLWNGTIKKTIAGLKGMKLALAATGVGAVVALLGVAVSKISQLIDKNRALKESQDELNESTKTYKDILNEINSEEETAIGQLQTREAAEAFNRKYGDKQQKKEDIYKGLDDKDFRYIFKLLERYATDDNKKNTPRRLEGMDIFQYLNFLNQVGVDKGNISPQKKKLYDKYGNIGGEIPDDVKKYWENILKIATENNDFFDFILNDYKKKADELYNEILVKRKYNIDEITQEEKDELEKLYFELEENLIQTARTDNDKAKVYAQLQYIRKNLFKPIVSKEEENVLGSGGGDEGKISVIQALIDKYTLLTATIENSRKKGVISDEEYYTQSLKLYEQYIKDIENATPIDADDLKLQGSTLTTLDNSLITLTNEYEDYLKEMARLESENRVTRMQNSSTRIDLGKRSKMAREDINTPDDERVNFIDRFIYDNVNTNFTKRESLMLHWNERLIQLDIEAKNRELDILNEQYNSGLILADEYYTQRAQLQYDLTTLEQEQSNERINIIKAENENKKMQAQNFVSASTSILGGMSELFSAIQANLDTSTEEGFRKNQQFSIANSTVSYLQGLISAWSSSMSLGPILGPIAGGTLSALLTGVYAANIAQIKSTQFNTSGATAQNNTQAIQSIVNPITNVRQTTTKKDEENMKSTRVYVLESDISNALNSKKVLVQNNTF